MSTTHIALLGFWAIAMILWSRSAGGPWAARVYDKVGPESGTWYWLRILGLPRTRENCIRFLKVVSLAGMILVTLGVVASFLLVD